MARLTRRLGMPARAQHAPEQWLATLGGALGIGLTFAVTRTLAGPNAAVVVVPSLAASAVLIFGAPHSQFAQPWAVIVGHLVSAVIGVACQHFIPQPVFAAAAAVGLAIGAMHLTRSIHPPGGATALGAVIGGPAIHALGFTYVLLPVGLTAGLIVLAGIGFNYAFAWRRYPAALMRYATVAGGVRHPVIETRHVRRAMADFKGVVDAVPEEITEVLNAALELARQEAGQLTLAVGRYYCNDRVGQAWSVRQIVEERPSDVPEFDVVVYRVVDGQGLHRHGSCTRTEFAEWVGSEYRPALAN